MYLGCFSERRNREGVWGREGLNILPDRRLADDGKRREAEMDVVCPLLLAEKFPNRGGEGSEIRADRRAGG